jgi:hypothetical protein
VTERLGAERPRTADISAGGLDWSRALLRRGRSQLEHIPRERMQPLIATLTALNERLAGLQPLTEAI